MIVAVALVVAANSVAQAQTGPAPDLSVIEGVDRFEPDNTPAEATWVGLVGDNSTVSNLTRHNFHEPGDEDWFVLFADSGLDITTRTIDLLDDADTFVSVYRVLQPQEDVAANRPPACLEDSIEGPGGSVLVPVGCNDDANAATLRSQVSFNAEVRGLYYVRVMASPRVSNTALKAEESGSGTSYSFDATFPGSGIFSNALFVTVLDSEDDTPINNATVTLQPSSFTVTGGTNGVYTFAGVPDGSYTVTAEAPGFQGQSQFVSLAGGESEEVIFRLDAVPPPDARHSADFEAPFGSWRLNELLRVIQLFNADAYHCDGDSEDGFAPGPGGTGCAVHDSDFVSADFVISLTELLRGVQFFAVGDYEACEGSEDGFCPKQE